MGKSARKEVIVILKALEAQGWRIEEKGDKALAWPPDGKTQPVPIHYTPSDHRWRKNLVAMLRRAGASIQ